MHQFDNVKESQHCNSPYLHVPPKFGASNHLPSKTSLPLMKKKKRNMFKMLVNSVACTRCGQHNTYPAQYSHASTSQTNNWNNEASQAIPWHLATQETAILTYHKISCPQLHGISKWGKDKKQSRKTSFPFQDHSIPHQTTELSTPSQKSPKPLFHLPPNKNLYIMNRRKTNIRRNWSSATTYINANRQLILVTCQDPNIQVYSTMKCCDLFWV